MAKKALTWLGYAAIIAAILFFLAPESWWQFGVTPVAKRPAAASFQLKTLAGDEWNISDQRGKVVVVNYWATWCGPCRVEMPGLVSFATEFKDKGVEMIGVTMDEDISVVPPFVKDYSINYPIALPNYDAVPDAQGFPLPTTMLYDKSGRLAKRYTGIVLESTLRSDTELLLAE
jgi:thiol-disulfide isomerase/thioredoxin